MRAKNEVQREAEIKYYVLHETVKIFWIVTADGFWIDYRIYWTY
jgi:hypothetical protein